MYARQNDDRVEAPQVRVYYLKLYFNCFSYSMRNTMSSSHFRFLLYVHKIASIAAHGLEIHLLVFDFLRYISCE